jgi:hypothetical protein
MVLWTGSIWLGKRAKSKKAETVTVTISPNDISVWFGQIIPRAVIPAFSPQYFAKLLYELRERSIRYRSFSMACEVAGALSSERAGHCADALNWMRLRAMGSREQNDAARSGYIMPAGAKVWLAMHAYGRNTNGGRIMAMIGESLDDVVVQDMRRGT